MIFSIDTLNTLIASMIPLGVIVTGVTNVAKNAFRIPARFVPVVALVLGGGLGLLFVENHILGTIVGIVVGLSSVGMWEVGTKAFNSR